MENRNFKIHDLVGILSVKLHYEAVFLHEEKRKEIIDYSNTSIKVIVCQ